MELLTSVGVSRLVTPTGPLVSFWRGILQELVCLGALCMLLVSSPVASVLGPSGYLMCIAPAVQNRGMTLGRVLRSVLLNTTGALVGVAYALVVAAILNALDATGSDTSLSRWAALTIFILVSTLVRSRYPETTLAYAIAGITVTVLLFSSVSTGLTLDQTRVAAMQIVLTFAVAEALGLLVTVVGNPIVASHRYRALNAAELVRLKGLLCSSLELLHKTLEKDIGARGSTLSSNANANVEAAVRKNLAASRAALPSIAQMGTEATLEFGRPFWMAPQTATLSAALERTAQLIHSTAVFAMDHHTSLHKFQRRFQTTSAASDLYPGADVRDDEDNDQDESDQLLRHEEEEEAVSMSQMGGSSSGTAAAEFSQSPGPQRITEFLERIASTADAMVAACANVLDKVHDVIEGPPEPDRVPMAIFTTATSGSNDVERGRFHPPGIPSGAPVADFDVIDRAIEDFERFNQEEMHATVRDRMRTFQLNYILTNLMELGQHLKVLNTATVSAYGSPVFGAGHGLAERLPTCALWHWMRMYEWSRPRRDELRDVLSGQDDKDPDVDALLSDKVWSYLQMLTSNEMKFAAKVAMAVGILLLIVVVVPELHTEHFLWTLFTILFVSSPTMGGNVFASVYRMIGTVLGCCYAIGAWYAAQENPFAVVAMSLPILLVIAYLKTATLHPRLGAQLCVAFMITLYAEYASRGLPTMVPIESLALQRIVAVGVGIVAVLLSSRVMFPHVARTELRHRMSTTLQDLSLIYSQMFSLFVSLSATAPAAKLHQLNHAVQLAQSDIYKARSLLTMTNNEPKLRPGRFNKALFEQLIDHSQHMLDVLVSSTAMLARGMVAPPSSTLRSQILAPMHNERRENHALIALTFYVLAAALHSKQSLPFYLPSTRETMSRLLKRLSIVATAQHHGQGTSGSEVLPPRLIMYYFGFLCSVDSIANDLTHIGAIVRKVVGVDTSFDPNADHAGRAPAEDLI